MNLRMTHCSMYWIISLYSYLTFLRSTFYIDHVINSSIQLTIWYPYWSPPLFHIDSWLPPIPTSDPESSPNPNLIHSYVSTTECMSYWSNGLCDSLSSLSKSQVHPLFPILHSSQVVIQVHYSSLSIMQQSITLYKSHSL